MSEQEIAALRAAFSQGAVLWQPYDSAPAIKVTHLGEDPKPSTESYVKEPGVLAFLVSPTGGFISLKNSELRDFLVAQQIKINS